MFQLVSAASCHVAVHYWRVSLHLPFWRTLSWSLPFSRLNEPSSFSLSSYIICCRLLTISVFSPGLAPVCWCTVDSESGHTAPDVVHGGTLLTHVQHMFHQDFQLLFCKTGVCLLGPCPSCCLGLFHPRCRTLCLPLSSWAFFQFTSTAC